MSEVPGPPQPRPRLTTRRDAPLWRQAAEGIGLVVMLSVGVLALALVLAVVVSLLF